MGGGCISISTGGGTGGTATSNDGGVYKSTDRGNGWAQKVAVPAIGGERRSIAGVNVATMVQDPQDPDALYIGTVESGMLFSYDGGETWQQPVQLTRGRIPAIAVHPRDKCTLFVAAENKLLKTEDCSRTFSIIYLDTRQDKLTSAVVVDHADPRVVWIANSGGDVLRSGDGGASWSLSRSFGNPVLRLAMNPADRRRLYAATKSAGIFRTGDGGANWRDMSDRYRTFPGSMEFSDLAVGAAQPQVLVFASRFGLLRSTDGGESWQAVPLLTPPGATQIYSLALDQRDTNVIYYGTSTTFYRSMNGGADWVTRRLPSSRTATVLMVDRANAQNLYMGVTRFR